MRLWLYIRSGWALARERQLSPVAEHWRWQSHHHCPPHVLNAWLQEAAGHLNDAWLWWISAAMKIVATDIAQQTSFRKWQGERGRGSNCCCCSFLLLFSSCVGMVSSSYCHHGPFTFSSSSFCSQHYCGSCHGLGHLVLCQAQGSLPSTRAFASVAMCGGR